MSIKFDMLKDQLIGSKSYPFKIVPRTIAMSSNIFSASFKALSSPDIMDSTSIFPFRRGTEGFAFIIISLYMNNSVAAQNELVAQSRFCPM